MIKYKINLSDLGKIEELYSASETFSRFDAIYDTWEAAHAQSIVAAKTIIDHCEAELRRARAILYTVETLKKTRSTGK